MDNLQIQRFDRQVTGNQQKFFEAGGGQEALDAAVAKWKRGKASWERIPGSTLKKLRQEIINKGRTLTERDYNRIRRFNMADPRKLKRRQDEALRFLEKYGITGEDAEKIINLRIDPEKVAKQHVDENKIPLVKAPKEDAVPEPAEPAAPVVPVGQNNADSEPLADAPASTPDEPVEPAPLQAAAITKPQTNRQLMVAEAKRKYKDSPFKQWAHANQKLAMAVKPGQAGYAQVQEYLKESGLLKTKDLQIKPKGNKQKSYLNIEQLQFNPGQARGVDGFTEGERQFVRPRPRSEQVDTPGMGMAMANPLRGYTG